MFLEFQDNLNLYNGPRRTRPIVFSAYDVRLLARRPPQHCVDSVVSSRAKWTIPGNVKISLTIAVLGTLIGTRRDQRSDGTYVTGVRRSNQRSTANAVRGVRIGATCNRNVTTVPSVQRPDAMMRGASPSVSLPPTSLRGPAERAQSLSGKPPPLSRAESIENPMTNLYFIYALHSTKPGDEVNVKVLRDGNPVAARVLLTKRPWARRRCSFDLTHCAFRAEARQPAFEWLER